MEEELSPLEELEVRIQNMETAIQIAQMELNVLLKQKKDMTDRKRIGFIIPKKDERKTK